METATLEAETNTKTAKTRGDRGTLRSSLPTLRNALAAVEPAVPERSPTPVLRNVLLKNGMAFATNNEMWISAPSGISGSLETLVPFGRLKQITTATRAADELLLKQTDATLQIKASDGKWTLATEPVESFPVREEPACTPLARLPADQFHVLMKSVVLACAKDPGRYSLNAVLIEFTDGVLSFVATDGHRLCFASCDIDQSLNDASVLVPRKAIDALLKLSALGGDKAIQLSYTASSIVATIDEKDGDEKKPIRFEATAMSGVFPKWRDADKHYSLPASRTPAGVLLNAIRMCAVCSSETSRGIEIRVGDEAAEFRASSIEYGKAESRCELSAVGGAFSLTFDPRLACDWLATLDPSEPVQIFGDDAASPIVLASINSKCVISPIVKE